MVLDPFTAIGLAGNIVQFVDYSSKLIASTYEIYNSNSGSSANHVYLEGVATRLFELSHALEQPKLTPTKNYEKGLQALREECVRDTQTLIDLIKALQAKEHSKWGSFRKALLSIWKKEEIERLEKRLQNHRGEIATHLAAMLSDQNSSIMSILKKMVEENRKLDIQRSDQLQELKAKIDEIGRTKAEVTSSDFEKLQESLSNLVRTGQEILMEQNILKSLRFREIKVRIEKISEAHTKTLQWLLQHHGPDQPVRFLEWLESSAENQPPYWVGGKAGSGKSTLMKFICNHPKTTEALRIWAGSDMLVTASFFFWSYGTEMQKSQEGLLQTLLHEILRKCPNLIQKCLSHRWNIEHQDSWNRSELLGAFSKLSQESITSTRFCLFIDGLDEYNGDPRELLPIIKDLSDSPNVKICVSGRPWQIFKDAFDKNPLQRLYLQDLTRNDIQAYVRSNFETDVNFLQAKEDDAGYEELVDEVVERAQGVFLWVALVTKSLLNGFTYGDSLRTLQMRLQHLPMDLEEFFQHMLDSVEPVYQTQMAETFMVALAANEDLPLILYSFLDDIAENPEFALSFPTHTRSRGVDTSGASERLKREVRMQKRLDARTKGLLEVSKRWTGNTWYNNRVDFLHRSVGDFLNRKDIKARFTESAGPSYNPKISLCHGLLAVIKFTDSLPNAENSTLHAAGGHILEELIHELLEYAYVSESESAIAQSEVLDELEGYLCSTHPSTTVAKRDQKRQWMQLDRKLLKNSESHTLFELSVQHHLYLYVKQRLELDTTLVSSKQWHRPLLSHALSTVLMATRRRTVDPACMVRLLLEHGADPNAVDGESTTWRKYVHDIIDRPSKSKLEIMHLLLSKGADPSGGGSVLLETLTIVSTSPAKVYQMPMFDKLLDAGANPNAKFDDSTVWKRFLSHLLHGKSGLRNRTGLHDEFQQVKRLLLAGADPSATVSGQSVDQIIQETFGCSHVTELLDLLGKMHVRTGGGFLSRVWKW